MPEYIRGLEKGLSILKDMREYQVDSDITEMPQMIRAFLDLIIADYTDHIEAEKAKLLGAKHDA